MRATRIALGTLGGAGAAYGLLLLLGLGAGQLVAVLVWVVGGIVVHDGVVAPLVVVACVAAAGRAPTWSRTPLLWALVVLGPLTLVAVPVLGRFGAKADNATLLDRPYWLGYAGVVGLVMTVAVIAALRRRSSGEVRAAAPAPGGVAEPPRIHGAPFSDDG